MTPSDKVRKKFLEKFADRVEDIGDISDMPSFAVPADTIVEACEYLKSEPELGFDYLMSLTAVDRTEDFEVVYHLYSIPLKHYITLKVKVGREKPAVPTVTGVWKAADWQEREVYDMFGIDFEGHPDLRRILLEQDWVGFPLRKDYVEA